MGVFDNLGAVFSTRDEEEAARVAAAGGWAGARAANRGIQRGIQRGSRYMGQADRNLEQGLRGANQDYAAALRSHQQGFQGARRGLQQGYGDFRQDVTRGLDRGIGAYRQGIDTWRQMGDQIRGDLGQGFGQAQAFYQPLAQTFNRGMASYADAMGLNGPEGIARAQQAFQAGPGYQFQLGQGQQALERAASAGGMLGSGNLATDAMRYGQGLANQEWGSHLGRLGGYNNLASHVAGAQAGLSTDYARLLADAQARTAQGVAGLQAGIGDARIQAGQVLGQGAMTHGGQMAGLHTGLANARAGVQGQMAGADLQTAQQQAAHQADWANQMLAAQTGMGQNVAGAHTNAATQHGNAILAQQGAGQNMIGTGLAVGQMALNAMGMPTGGGGSPFAPQRPLSDPAYASLYGGTGGLY